jgi:hypothetical protein
VAVSIVALSAATLIVSGPFETVLAVIARGALVSCDFKVALDADDPETSPGRASHSGMGGRKGDAK